MPWINPIRQEGSGGNPSRAPRMRMPGFTAHLADVLGEVTTDWYGNPLCTTYRPTTAPGRGGYETVDVSDLDHPTLISGSVSMATWRGLGTRAGGEVISADSY